MTKDKILKNIHGTRLIEVWQAELYITHSLKFPQNIQLPPHPNPLTIMNHFDHRTITYSLNLYTAANTATKGRCVLPTREIWIKQISCQNTPNLCNACNLLHSKYFSYTSKDKELCSEGPFN